MRGAPTTCDGDRDDRGIIPADAGSTRGAPSCRVRDDLRPGIIPADAGSTLRLLDEPFPDWDHPRGCGEHENTAYLDTREWGSSPRMRGALNPIGNVITTVGIIPADAGSTSYRERRPRSTRDHPRGCGEHETAANIALAGQGSSPRMRGALPHRRQSRVRRGIIPADAGSTSQHDRLARLRGDHPRGCGEHPVQLGKTSRVEGSSPRMRGARRASVLQRHGRGIIPADAGSTRPASSRSPSARDHPRGCGEHRDGAERVSADDGSSPRMRGAPRCRRRHHRGSGIIPADAGSTPRTPARDRSPWDHPRGCGEHEP